jgi:hypothetical protein
MWADPESIHQGPHWVKEVARDPDAFFCFLRMDHFTVDKADAFNSRRHLCHGDVVFGQFDVTFTFRHSKTNQFHARVHRTKAVRIPGHLLVAEQAYVMYYRENNERQFILTTQTIDLLPQARHVISHPPSNDATRLRE